MHPWFWMAALLLVCVASADAQTLATLRVKSEKTESGIVTLVLQSGNVIEVLEADLYGMVKGGAPVPPASAPPLPPVNVAPQAPSPSPLSKALQDIRNFCASRWNTNFSMRVFCENEQKEAMAKLDRRVEAGFMNSDTGRTIMLECGRKWEPNYSMIEFCVDEQVKAVQQLSR
jgi:hypothetical protein